MPTIRDVVQTLSNREGVDAVVLLSRDGLTIDAQASNGVDPDGLAALVPGVVAACTRLGSAAERGGFGTSVLEFEQGIDDRGFSTRDDKSFGLIELRRRTNLKS